MKKFIKENSLSIVFLLLFLVAMAGQFITGYQVYLGELADEGAQQIRLSEYLRSGHFFYQYLPLWCFQSSFVRGDPASQNLLTPQIVKLVIEIQLFNRISCFVHI